VDVLLVTQRLARLAPVGAKGIAVVRYRSVQLDRSVPSQLTSVKDVGVVQLARGFQLLDHLLHNLVHRLQRSQPATEEVVQVCFLGRVLQRKLSRAQCASLSALTSLGSVFTHDTPCGLSGLKAGVRGSCSTGKWRR